MSSTDLIVDMEDIEFCLFDWLDISQLQDVSKYEDFDSETMRLLLREGTKFAREVIAPTNVEADREGCRIVDGAVAPRLQGTMGLQSLVGADLTGKPAGHVSRAGVGIDHEEVVHQQEEGPQREAQDRRSGKLPEDVASDPARNEEHDVPGV
jgi:hypothetical protein